MATAPLELWVLLRSYEPSVVNQAVLVSTQGCRFVTHFIKAIKNELFKKLADVDPDNITLHETEDGPPLRPGLELSLLVGQNTFINTKKTALIVKVPPPAGKL